MTDDEIKELVSSFLAREELDNNTKTNSLFGIKIEKTIRYAEQLLKSDRTEKDRNKYLKDISYP